MKKEHQIVMVNSPVLFPEFEIECPGKNLQRLNFLCRMKDE